jgi:hypothetical protein
VFLNSFRVGKHQTGSERTSKDDRLRSPLVSSYNIAVNGCVWKRRVKEKEKREGERKRGRCLTATRIEHFALIRLEKVFFTFIQAPDCRTDHVPDD